MGIAIRRLAGLRLPDLDSALLIAGSGHTRVDPGVPWHLALLVPGQQVATLTLVEVESKRNDPTAYAVLFGAEVLPLDSVWFTPRIDLLHPCEAYAEQFERAGERHKERE